MAVLEEGAVPALRAIRAKPARSLAGIDDTQLIRLSDRNAQMRIPKPRIGIWRIDQPGDAHPFPDPGFIWPFAQFREAFRPDIDFDDVAFPESEVDTNVWTPTSSRLLQHAGVGHTKPRTRRRDDRHLVIVKLNHRFSLMTACELPEADFVA